MFLTYHMVKWEEVSQEVSDQKCTKCGRRLNKTEDIVDQKGVSYEGYVCHPDKQVTWLRVS
jgi:hypothetical protein